VVAERLEAEHRLHEVRQEWSYVARGLDKIFMLSFIVFTILYQAWLFSQTNITPKMVSEEFMNRTSAT
jgi:hypothetical protein